MCQIERQRAHRVGYHERVGRTVRASGEVDEARVPAGEMLDGLVLGVWVLAVGLGLAPCARHALLDELPEFLHVLARDYFVLRAAQQEHGDFGGYERYL